MRIKLKSTIIITAIATLAILNSDHVSALEYQTAADIDFTINPSITVTLSSSDLVIDELSPGTSSDSNSIVVNVLTNNAAGYTLTANVGSNDYPTSGAYNLNDLIHTNLTNKFVGLSTSDSLSSPTDFEPGTWGYSYAITSTTNTETGSSEWNWFNYSGLPAYTTASTTLREKYIPANDDIGFKVAARADSVQASGTYTNKINFAAVGNVEMKYYMQNFTNSMCQTLAADNNYIVYDYRDNNDYTVRYINGACWMTQNLRIDGVISAEYSNFTGDDINVSRGDLDQTAGTCSGAECNSYAMPMTHNSGNTINGVWYNYAAATAETIIGQSIATEAQQDICPANWRLPDRATDAHSGSINSIVNYKTLFSPIYGGYYHGGTLSYPSTYGTWWTSTAKGDNTRYGLRHNNDSLGAGNDYYARVNGAYIRCVRTL